MLLLSSNPGNVNENNEIFYSGDSKILKIMKRDSFTVDKKVRLKKSF